MYTYPCSLDFWVCKPEAAHIIQEYAKEMSIICLCEASEDVGLTIYYFSRLMTSLEYLTTTEATIDEIIHQKFASDSITVFEDVNVTVMDEYFQKLQESCVRTLDKDFTIMIRWENQLLLFGLTHVVKRITNEHKKMKSKLAMAEIYLDLEDYQVCVIKKAMLQCIIVI